MWILRITLCALVIGGIVLPSGNARGEEETPVRKPEALTPDFRSGAVAKVDPILRGETGTRWLSVPADAYVVAALCRVHLLALHREGDLVRLRAMLEHVATRTQALETVHADVADTHRARAEILWAQYRLEEAMEAAVEGEALPPSDELLRRASTHAVRATKLKSAHRASHLRFAARLLWTTYGQHPLPLVRRDRFAEGLALFALPELPADDSRLRLARAVLEAGWLTASVAKVHTTMPDGRPIAAAAAKTLGLLASSAAPGTVAGERHAAAYNALMPRAIEAGWRKADQWLTRTVYSRWGYIAADLPRGLAWRAVREGAENAILMTTLTTLRPGITEGVTVRMYRYNLRQGYPVGATRTVEGRNVRALMAYDESQHRTKFRRAPKRSSWTLEIGRAEDDPTKSPLRARGYRLRGTPATGVIDKNDGPLEVQQAMWTSRRHTRVFAIEVIVTPNATSEERAQLAQVLRSLREVTSLEDETVEK